MLCALMMSERGIQRSYHPLSEDSIKITQSKAFLQQMMKAMNSIENSNFDFSETLEIMCRDNLEASKKVTKALLRELLNNNIISEVVKGLKCLRALLSISDSLVQHRFEWIFGVPQLVCKRNFKQKSVEFGVVCIDAINQEAHSFKSSIIKGQGESLLSDIFRGQRTRSDYVSIVLRELLQWCIQDDKICEFIYKLPPPCYQFARFSDWF